MATGKRKYLIWGSAAVLAGIIGYIIWKKRKGKAKEECIKNGGTYDDATKTCTLPPKVDPINNTVVNPVVNPVVQTITETVYPATGLSKVDGDAFRAWVNTKYPAYAKTAKLDLTGPNDNPTIRKAFVEYGNEWKTTRGTVTNGITILPSDALKFNAAATYLGTPIYFSSNGVGRYTKRNFNVNMESNVYLMTQHSWLLLPLTFFVFEADSDQPVPSWKIKNNADKEVATGAWEQNTKSLRVWTSNYPNVIKAGGSAYTDSTQQTLTVLFGNLPVKFV